MLEGKLTKALSIRRLLPVPAAIAAALLFYIAAYYTRDVTRVGDLADQAIDRALSLTADHRAQHPAQKTVILDFNDLTLTRFGNPPFIPPDVVSTVLQRVAEMEPEAIVLDIDISWVREERDVEAISRGLQSAEAQGKVLLLLRALDPDPVNGQRTRFAPTAFDTIVEASDRLAWVSAEAIKSADGSIRAMAPLTKGFQGEGVLRLPSPQLLLLLRGSDEGLDRALKRFSAGADTLKFETEQGDIDLSGRDNARILYTERWPPKPGGRILVFPAAPLLIDDAPIDTSDFKGALVIIGSSAALKADVHETALGPMPGVYILANALTGWLVDGPYTGSPLIAGMSIVAIGGAFLAALVILVLSLIPVFAQSFARSVLPGLAVAGVWLAAELLAVSVEISWLMILAYPVTWIAVYVFPKPEGVTR